MLQTSRVDFIEPVTLYSTDNEGNFTKEINEIIKVNVGSDEVKCQGVNQ